MRVDSDRLLLRKLYLQRYVTAVYNDVIESNRSFDKELLLALGDFVLDADERTLAALSAHRRSNKQVAELFAEMRRIVKAQTQATKDIFSDQVPKLVESEGAATAAAIAVDQPSMLGVATLPVAGLAVSQIFATAYQRFNERLVSQVTGQAVSNPQSIVSIVRGRKTERFRDGLFFWRNERLLRTNVDMVVNGVAANSASHIFTSEGVRYLDYVATLDFRTCPRCYTAEMGSPYERDKIPPTPQHPNCRCLHIPHDEDGERNKRPYVEDFRSVKDIPKDQRVGRIGQTKDNIEQFFNRMTKEQRRDYMGKTRSALWEQGKITDIKQLVDSRTLRPLRLEQLPNL